MPSSGLRHFARRCTNFFTLRPVAAPFCSQGYGDLSALLPTAGTSSLVTTQSSSGLVCFFRFKMVKSIMRSWSRTPIAASLRALPLRAWARATVLRTAKLLLSWARYSSPRCYERGEMGRTWLQHLVGQLPPHIRVDVCVDLQTANKQLTDSVLARLWSWLAPRKRRTWSSAMIRSCHCSEMYCPSLRFYRRSTIAWLHSRARALSPAGTSKPTRDVAPTFEHSMTKSYHTRSRTRS